MLFLSPRAHWVKDTNPTPHVLQYPQEIVDMSRHRFCENIKASAIYRVGYFCQFPSQFKVVKWGHLAKISQGFPSGTCCPGHDARNHISTALRKNIGNGSSVRQPPTMCVEDECFRVFRKGRILTTYIFASYTLEWYKMQTCVCTYLTHFI